MNNRAQVEVEEMMLEWGKYVIYLKKKKRKLKIENIVRLAVDFVSVVIFTALINK